MKTLLLVSLALAASRCMVGQAMQCERIDSGMPALRAESTAELLPDIVLRCKAGGAVATAGSYQVIVSANTGLTNRDISPIAAMNWGWNDALLLVNDPVAAAQVGCVPADGQTACSAQSNANVFQGKRLDDASLVFQGVLIPTPASGKFVTLRIVNLRVDATAIASSKEAPAIHTDVKIFGPQGGGLVPVASAERDSAVTRESLRFSARNADGIPVTSPVLITPSSLPMQNPSAKRAARVSFAELFPNAFRRRNSGTSFEDPKFVAAQSLPGAAFQTETGFYNPALPKATRMNEAGLADTGTRLMVRFTGVPANTGLWVSTQDGNQRAALSYGESNGSGAFSPMAPWVPGWAQLYVDNGSAVAIWEVVNADPEELEQLTFSVTLTALNGNPGFGVLKAVGQMGPVDHASLPSFRAASEEGAIAIIELANGVELPKISVLSSASFAAVPLAPGALSTVVSTFIEPSTNGSALAIDLIDSIGRKTRITPLAMASGQASFVLPDKVRTGPAVLNLVADGDVLASESVLIQNVSPSLFSASGDGVGIPVGEVLYLGSNTAPTPLAVFDEPSGKWVATPVMLTDAANGTVYVSVLATGVHNRSQLSAVSAVAGGRTIPAILATPHPEMTGVDIVTFGPLPRELKGNGATAIQIVADGYSSQPLTILIR